MSRGFLPSLSGVPALLVCSTASEPSGFLTSQAHPEPNCVMAALVSFSLKAAKDVKFLAMASARAPLGSPPPLGYRQFQ